MASGSTPLRKFKPTHIYHSAAVGMLPQAHHILKYEVRWLSELDVLDDSLQRAEVAWVAILHAVTGESLWVENAKVLAHKSRNVQSLSLGTSDAC